VAGYAVMRVDPAVVEIQESHASNIVADEPAFAVVTEPRSASEEVREAFA
jgi:3-oxoacyl-[acyl-carrier-protein] synthase-3